MEFIRSCEAMAALLEEEIRGLVGTADGDRIVRMGADGTPTKKIDHVAEEIVVGYLTDHSLCGTVISEEQGTILIGDHPGTVFLDPIDGTYNAVKGIPFYALSVAIAEDGRVMKGYVRDLSHGESFYAIRGQGAFLNGEPIRVSTTSLLEKSAMSVYGKKFNPATVLRLGRKIRRSRLLGASAIELCYVACGRIDGFIDLRNTLRVTDAAAGMLICDEAGGMLSDHQGKEVDFPPSVTAGRCLVATNGKIHGKVIEYLQE
jgi:myo-inositol-1(or 4)-monophosphatase